MQIFMRLEYERVTRTVACDVDPRETLYSLKCKIQDKGNGIRPAIQRKHIVANRYATVMMRHLPASVFSSTIQFISI